MAVAEVAQIPRLSWPEFRSELAWEQGEHLTCIGATKSGKTTLMRELLRDARQDRTHPWQVVFVTKRYDNILYEYEQDGFERIPEWIVTDAAVMPHVLLAPSFRGDMGDVEDRQRRQFRYALTSIFRQGGWLVYLDELRHITSYLGLERDVEMLLHQGRSAGVTVVGGVQRPRHVPLMAYDQATHLFFWHARDANMRKRLSEIGGKVDPELVVRGVDMVSYHEFVYVNPISGEIYISQVEM